MISCIRSTGLVLCLTAAVAFHAVSARADDPAKPARIVTMLSSADRLIADLNFIVVDLAKESQQWENNIFPNIDIFLIGVDTQLPVGFDVLFDADTGIRYQPQIPVTDMKSFIQDNLEPIGIEPKRRGRGYWELEGNVFPGWMRELDGYASIAKVEGDVPKDMVTPRVGFEPMQAQKYVVGAHLSEESAPLADRERQFAKYKENMLAGATKRPDESREVYALRRQGLENRLEFFERVFIQSSEILGGWSTTLTSESNADGHANVTVMPVADTLLAQFVSAVGETPSHFAAVPVADDPVLNFRVMLPLMEGSKERLSSTYELARPVIHQQIDEDEEVKPEEKEPRKQIADILLDMVTAGLQLPAVDGFTQITRDGDLHTFVAGIRSADGTAVEKVIELVPQARAGWKSETNIETVGEVSIHRVTLKEGYPKALVEFFGDGGELYVGASKDAVWLAAGANSLEAMKTAIEQREQGGESAEATPSFLTIEMHAQPLLKVAHQAAEEEDFSLLQFVQISGLADQAESQSSGTTEDGEERRSTRDALKDFEWQETAIRALQGEGMSDRIEIDFRRKKTEIFGTLDVHNGMLRAAGKLIAKFAKENLGA
ncbi:hypothetical protein Mal4_51930 [Maioricimonas rarisocia]|uniref:Secreted protein n=1 Tax=Maioricimonas rarisocia TaxID=2528026 RepID=A0A517ZEC0_9PLAN|nr:hypothetical protein [Maioricimonas rarisocia]QDU40831.1 hypothetical protein Mal4_51930 [Maioricimonas rarisocia]